MTPLRAMPARDLVLDTDERTGVATVPLHAALDRALAAAMADDLRVGTSLGPAQLAALAARDVHEVATHEPTAVGLVTIDPQLTGNEAGDELAVAPAALGLIATLGRAGQIPVDMGAVPDDAELHRAALSRAFEMVEVIVTIGGDEARWARDAVAQFGGEVRFSQVAQTPCGRLCFALLDEGWWFGLPADPGDALLAAEVFVKPLARKLAGHRAYDAPRFRVRLAKPAEAGRVDQWHWARLLADGSAELLPGPLTAEGFAFLPARDNGATVHETAELFITR
jgi:molybdopterin molybdotransferase